MQTWCWLICLFSLNTRGALNQRRNIHLNGDELPPVSIPAARSALTKPACVCVCRQTQMPEVAAWTHMTSVKKRNKAILLTALQTSRTSSAGCWRSLFFHRASAGRQQLQTVQVMWLPCNHPRQTCFFLKVKLDAAWGISGKSEWSTIHPVGPRPPLSSRGSRVMWCLWTQGDFYLHW